MKVGGTHATKKRVGSSTGYESDENQFLMSDCTKKLKTNSGRANSTTSTLTATTTTTSTTSTASSTASYVRTAEEILRVQQNINHDTRIDNDGFREIFPSELSSELQEAVYTESTLILRDAAGPKGFNTNSNDLFHFDQVAINHAQMEIECRIQNPSIYDFNVDNQKNQQHIYKTTIAEYGEYARLLAECKYDEIKKKEYYKHYFSKLSNGVMFAVNIDMDDFTWRAENNRLRATLPHFLLNKGKHDLLSYHRQNVMGCTQPQMYMKVPGVWTGGHQENISVRAININHGDGESDWYCVDYDQVEKFRNHIKRKHNVDIHESEGMWFGKYNDPELAKIGVRIKKVVQRKNDIVILAPGVLHWVRCRGKSVQTAWNFAYRRIEDIIAMNDRFQYNQKINFQTILLNKTLFMDLLNFEYHNLSLDVSTKLLSLVEDYYSKELAFEDSLVLSPLKSKNIVVFYDQTPAQLKQIQIYYCSESTCAKEIFSYFGVLRSEFMFLSESIVSIESMENLSEFCGKYYCPSCLINMKKVDDAFIVFRKFDLNSLKALLRRTRNFIEKQALPQQTQPQPLYPIPDLTNIGHFCGQIQNINDFIFNKDIRRLEQVYIPDVFLHQGVEQMHRFQLDLQQDKLLDFIDRPIMKFVTPNLSQGCSSETEFPVESAAAPQLDNTKMEDESQEISSSEGIALKQQQTQRTNQSKHLLSTSETSKTRQTAQSTEADSSDSQKSIPPPPCEDHNRQPAISQDVKQQLSDEKLAILLAQQTNQRTTRHQQQQQTQSGLINLLTQQIPEPIIEECSKLSSVQKRPVSICSKLPNQNKQKKQQQQQQQQQQSEHQQQQEPTTNFNIIARKTTIAVPIQPNPNHSSSNSCGSPHQSIFSNTNVLSSTPESFARHKQQQQQQQLNNAQPIQSVFLKVPKQLNGSADNSASKKESIDETYSNSYSKEFKVASAEKYSMNNSQSQGSQKHRKSLVDSSSDEDDQIDDRQRKINEERRLKQQQANAIFDEDQKQQLQHLRQFQTAHEQQPYSIASNNKISPEQVVLSDFDDTNIIFKKNITLSDIAH